MREKGRHRRGGLFGVRKREDREECLSLYYVEKHKPGPKPRLMYKQSMRHPQEWKLNRSKKRKGHLRRALLAQLH